MCRYQEMFGYGNMEHLSSSATLSTMFSHYAETPSNISKQLKAKGSLIFKKMSQKSGQTRSHVGR
jgi:hypothetical protein